MINSNSQINYIGSELDLFKNAINWKSYFSKKITPYIKGDVLEVGAGLGINTEYMSQNAHAIDSWWFVEPDPELSKQIQKNTEHININKKNITNGIITDITNQKFDTIIYIDVLEHIEESKKEIENAKARLKPNGHLIILVPAYNFLYNSFDKKIGHYRRYSKKLLRDEVNNLLIKEKLFYLDSIGFFASLANKLVLKKELPTLENVKLWDTFMVTCSKIFDILFLHSFGKSLIGIYKNK